MAGGGFHGEAGRVDLLSIDETSCSDALEHRLLDHEHHRAEHWARNFSGQKPRDYECAVVDQGVSRDSNLNEAPDGFGAAFDLNRDVLTVGPSVDHSIQTAIQHRQENMKGSARLRYQRGPREKFHRLAGGLGVHSSKCVQLARLAGLAQIWPIFIQRLKNVHPQFPCVGNATVRVVPDVLELTSIRPE